MTHLTMSKLSVLLPVISDLNLKLRERVSRYEIQCPVLNPGKKSNPYLFKIQFGRAITRFSFILIFRNCKKKSLADSVGLDQ